MSDEQNQGNTDNIGENPDQNNSATEQELTLLKARAKLMGINYSNNIGLEALKQKVKEAMEKPEEKVEETKPEPEEGPQPERKLSLREHLINEKMKLVRLRIHNLDPKKKDLPGEIFTFANDVLGTVRKFVPYGEYTDEGYHVPYCIYEQLRDREFLNIQTKKSGRNADQVKTGWVKEFSLDVLPPLTEKELNALSVAQMAREGIE